MLIFLRRLRSFSPKGFTLTELMVVISIMTILTSVFLLQQRQFDSTTLLRSFAYSVALSIQKAQTYGVSVRSFEGVFAKAHGIHFEVGDLPDYYLFSDINPGPNGDRARDSGGTEDIQTLGPSGSQFSIVKFCATRLDDTEFCSDSSITSLTILFIRPNPDACIATSENPSACVAGNVGDKYKSAQIQVAGPGGVTRSVFVSRTGQISVGKSGT